MAEGAARAVGAGRLDGVSYAFGASIDTVRHDREIGRKQTIIVDEDNKGKALGHAGADELCDQFATDGTPGMVHPVGGANGFGIVEGRGRVAVGEDLQY